MTENRVQKLLSPHCSQSSLAKAIGISQQSVRQWFVSGHIPAERAVQVEKALNGKVKRHQLLPELFKGYKPTTNNKEIIKND